MRKVIKLLAFIFEHPSYVFRYKCDNLLLYNHKYCLAILSMSFNYMEVGRLSSLIVYIGVIVVVLVCFLEMHRRLLLCMSRRRCLMTACESAPVSAQMIFNIFNYLRRIAT